MRLLAAALTERIGKSNSIAKLSFPLKSPIMGSSSYSPSFQETAGTLPLMLRVSYISLIGHISAGSPQAGWEGTAPGGQLTAAPPQHSAFVTLKTV